MTEPAAGPSGPGTVIMELGAGVGALILYTPADLDGEEIEISRDGDPGPSARIRGSGRGTCPARPGTRPSTRACQPGSTRSGATSAARRPPCTVAGGQVSSCDWPNPNGP